MLATLKQFLGRLPAGEAAGDLDGPAGTSEAGIVGPGVPNGAPMALSLSDPSPAFPTSTNQHADLVLSASEGRLGDEVGRSPSPPRSPTAAHAGLADPLQNGHGLSHGPSSGGSFSLPSEAQVSANRLPRPASRLGLLGTSLRHSIPESPSPPGSPRAVLNLDDPGAVFAPPSPASPSPLGLPNAFLTPPKATMSASQRASHTGLTSPFGPPVERCASTTAATVLSRRPRVSYNGVGPPPHGGHAPPHHASSQQSLGASPGAPLPRHHSHAHGHVRTAVASGIRSDLSSPTQSVTGGLATQITPLRAPPPLTPRHKLGSTASSPRGSPSAAGGGGAAATLAAAIAHLAEHGAAPDASPPCSVARGGAGGGGAGSIAAAGRAFMATGSTGGGGGGSTSASATFPLLAVPHSPFGPPPAPSAAAAAAAAAEGARCLAVPPGSPMQPPPDLRRVGSAVGWGLGARPPPRGVRIPGTTECHVSADSGMLPAAAFSVASFSVGGSGPRISASSLAGSGLSMTSKLSPSSAGLAQLFPPPPLAAAAGPSPRAARRHSPRLPSGPVEGSTSAGPSPLFGAVADGPAPSGPSASAATAAGAATTDGPRRVVGVHGWLSPAGPHVSAPLVPTWGSVLEGVAEAEDEASSASHLPKLSGQSGQSAEGVGSEPVNEDSAACTACDVGEPGPQSLAEVGPSSLAQLPIAPLEPCVPSSRAPSSYASAYDAGPASSGASSTTVNAVNAGAGGQPLNALTADQIAQQLQARAQAEAQAQAQAQDAGPWVDAMEVSEAGSGPGQGRVVSSGVGSSQPAHAISASQAQAQAQAQAPSGYERAPSQAEGPAQAATAGQSLPSPPVSGTPSPEDPPQSQPRSHPQSSPQPSPAAPPSLQPSAQSPRGAPPPRPPPPTDQRWPPPVVTHTSAPGLVTRSLPAADGALFLSTSAPRRLEVTHGEWSMRRFTVVRQLYKGYASRVSKAVYTRCPSAEVVLKAYDMAALSSFLRHQILRELDIHSRLNHPGVVHLAAAFKDGSLLVLVEEYVRGGSLDHVRRRMGGRMAEPYAVRLVLAPLLQTLVYLHGKGIVHRDIKPENLLLTEDWELRLADFGVSICLREERAVTRTGSHEYMAPEVRCCPLKHHPHDHKADDSLSYTPAVDVWSVGALMYELLVGFPPFPGGPPPRPRPDRPPCNPGTGPNPTPGAGTGSGSGSGSAGVKLAFPSSLGDDARSFVLACLDLDPADRPTAQDLLAHPWVRRLGAAAPPGAASPGQPSRSA